MTGRMASGKGGRPEVPKFLRLKFWDGKESDVDVMTAASRSLSVKGASFANPLRFMEIFMDERPPRVATTDPKLISGGRGTVSLMSYEEAKARYFPVIDGRKVDIGPSITLPPFCWREADAGKLAVSFTYNVNAFYRIFRNLSEQGKIPAHAVNNLVDRGCLLLSQIYKAGGHFVIQHINNNFNMYLITRVVQELVGAAIFSCDEQELDLTRRSLGAALKWADVLHSYSTLEKMKFSLVMGIAFIEELLQQRGTDEGILEETTASVFTLHSSPLAIDDRNELLQSIDAVVAGAGSFTLAAILDDATESVLDLLWMQDLVQKYPTFRLHLLVNTAQTSINFSAHMLDAVLSHESFRWLAGSLGGQLSITRLYCPFISFQEDLLPACAQKVVERADAVYVKGANFFETCQFTAKESYHAFVVYGPVSRNYAGLNDSDAVFVHLPAGRRGFIHHPDPVRIVSLKQMVSDSREIEGSAQV